MSEDSASGETIADEGTQGDERKAFGRTFWMLNSIEAFERLAYFGIRAVVPIYIMQATEPGGLHLEATDKGLIYGLWALFQSFLPIVTGGIADRYGYKRVLAFSITMNIIGYVMMAFLHSYAGFFAGILVLATGTAFFKPSLQGSLAQNLTKETSSVGWGVFYWVVNVGAFCAPFMSTAILGKPHSAQGWQNLFLACAAFTAVNLLLLFTFKDVPSGASKTENPLQVLWRTIKNIFEIRLIVWLLIMSCFWLMMYQLWDLHPNFIEDWVDSSSVAETLSASFFQEYGDRGLIRVPQQMLLNVNAGLIIVLMVPISWAVSRLRTLTAMLIGMAVATAGILIAGLTTAGWVLVLGIVFFSLGEMLTGPKKNEYLSLIAPPGKKAMYLGYVNIPVGIGGLVGSLLAGYIYGSYGEKASLALEHLEANQALVARAAQSMDWSDDLGRVVELGRVDREHAFELACEELGLGREAGARALNAAFRHDRGQLANLALQFLALHPEFSARAAVVAEGTELTEANVGRYIGALPKAIDVGRLEALDRVRHVLGPDAPADNRRLADLLWKRLGQQPENLNNLALEFLAQGTPLVRERVSRLTFDDTRGGVEEVVGIGRTKSFSALSVALGASEAEVEELLAGQFARHEDPAHRSYVYLIGRKHLLFSAVARRDWSNEVGVLGDLLGAEGKDLIDLVSGRTEVGFFTKLYHMIWGYTAEVMEALDGMDWSRHPEEAGYLLGINPYEARALAAAEIRNAKQTTTRLLWDTYNPQYKVWIPFALIGVVATIALGIFGAMAKRWKDMNA